MAISIALPLTLHKETTECRPEKTLPLITEARSNATPMEMMCETELDIIANSIRINL